MPTGAAQEMPTAAAQDSMDDMCAGDMLWMIGWCLDMVMPGEWSRSWSGRVGRGQRVRRRVLSTQRSLEPPRRGPSALTPR